MNIDEGKKSRAALKSYFVKNAIPTEAQFAQFIDSGLNQRDDGLVKAAGDPLSIEAAGDAASFKKAINFYSTFADAEPAFTLLLRPRANINDPNSGRLGLSIGDAAGNSRLCIDAATGNVGIGTTAPAERLDVAGRIKASTLTVGPWPNNPANYVFVGANTLNQSAPANYALLQGAAGADAGRTFLNSPVDIRFRIANTDRMLLTGDGRLGIGTGAPQRSVHVEGSEIHSGGSGAGFSFGNRQSAAFVDNGADGQRWVLYASANVARLWSAGNDRLMVTAAGELTVTGMIRSGRLVTGSWPANPNSYAFFGNTSLDHSNAVNYALLQETNSGRTFLNSPADIRFRINNADRMTLANNGDLTITQGALRVGGSDIYFTQTNHDHTGFGNAANNAAIENAANFGALMILGRAVTTNPLKRVVKLWDELTVNGPLIVTKSHTIKIGVPSPANPARYGNDGIRGEPNLWLDAAGTVFIKPGFQTPSGFDIAERFATVEPLAAGDVVVFDESANAIRRCDRVADPRAVGIVSGEAAFILGIDDAEVPVALCGRVPCFVDADVLPIRSGDLLTTSATPGHAQRAADPAACPGAIIGKALTSLASGKGSVLVLVNAY